MKFRNNRPMETGVEKILKWYGWTVISTRPFYKAQKEWHKRFCWNHVHIQDQNVIVKATKTKQNAGLNTKNRFYENSQWSASNSKLSLTTEVCTTKGASANQSEVNTDGHFVQPTFKRCLCFHTRKSYFLKQMHRFLDVMWHKLQEPKIRTESLNIDLEWISTSCFGSWYWNL